MSRLNSSAIRCSTAAPRRSRAGRADGAKAPDSAAGRRRAWDAAAANAEPSRSTRSRTRSMPASRTCFPTKPSRAAPRAAEGPAGYSEWAAVGAGGRDDGEYNLEAFVSAETTLADWLREQLTLADRRSGAPDDRAVPHRSGRRGRLLQPAISRRRRKSSAPALPKSRPCLAFCKASIRPGSARAISPNV